MNVIVSPLMALTWNGEKPQEPCSAFPGTPGASMSTICTMISPALAEGVIARLADAVKTSAAAAEYATFNPFNRIGRPPQCGRVSSAGTVPPHRSYTANGEIWIQLRTSLLLSGSVSLEPGNEAPRSCAERGASLLSNIRQSETARSERLLSH